MSRCVVFYRYAKAGRMIEKSALMKNYLYLCTIMEQSRFIMREAAMEHLDILSDYQVAMALETEDFQLNRDTVRKGVEACLLHPDRGRYYIVEDKYTDKVIACIMTMKEWSDWRCCWVIWLMSLYVHPDYRKKGIFKMMYDTLQKTVKTDPSLSGIRLYVDNRNIRAQKVYSAMGMSGEHYSLFEWMEEE